MKEIFRKLVCCSFLSIVSIGCFDAEARLPIYMAPQAAKLLIEKSGLKLKDGATKEAFAANLVDFLYSTDKRQHLANWMKNRINRGQIKTGRVTDAANTVNHFTALFNEIAGGYKDDKDFRRFVNQHFPCWTGTLTCFMLNIHNKAYIALLENNIVGICSDSITDDEQAKKIVGILFTLELVDNWDDIKQICKADAEADDAERLKEPPYDDKLDPYDCVPVPNTMYKIDESKAFTRYNTQGSCMVSTIRNLLCILCRSEDGTITLPPALRNAESLTSDLNDFVAGTTSPEALAKFVQQNLHFLSAQYEPTCALFISSLMSMLSPEASNEIDANAMMLSQLTVLHGRESECMGRIKEASHNEARRQQALRDYSTCNFFDKYSNLFSRCLTPLFKKITGHEGITVEFKPWPIAADGKKAVTSKNWPEYQLIITDPVVKKTITIGLGHSGGGGQHIEIINIENNT